MIPLTSLFFDPKDIATRIPHFRSVRRHQDPSRSQWYLACTLVSNRAWNQQKLYSGTFDDFPLDLGPTSGVSRAPWGRCNVHASSCTRKARRKRESQVLFVSFFGLQLQQIPISSSRRNRSMCIFLVESNTTPSARSQSLSKSLFCFPLICHPFAEYWM